MTILCFASQGALPGVFSVSADKKICFSSGNLQYNIAQGSHQCADGTTQPGTWSFAANQWDVIKNANENASATYDGWIDLFPWGASGYNGKFPYLSNASYNNSFFSNGNSDISGTMYDWGVYNEISNGGSYGVWRLPTAAEYEYLFTQRPNALNLYKKDVAVNNVKGLVLCPDNWDLTITILSSYTQSAWESMEAQGAVFLPYGGVKDYSLVGGVGWFFVGYYWSGTISPTEGKAIALDTYSMQAVGNNEHFMSHGRSVRLVREIPQSYTITWKNSDGTTLKTEQVAYGATPSYTGSTPTKASTAQYTYNFSGWTPSITAVTANKTYTATYTQTLRNYTINVNTSKVSQGTAAGGGTYDYGTNHQISATPNECYRFVQWSDGNTDNPRTITVTGDATYTAEFEQIQYTIEALPDNPAQGSATVTNP